MRTLFLLLAAALLLLPAPTLASSPAQEPPDGPVYIVQQGDSLWDIAARFRVSMADLQAANGISNPSQLSAGARLVIPGLSGVKGVLTTRPIQIGENLRSLSRHFQVPEDILIRLNHITSPAELYAGSTLVLPLTETSAPATKRSLVTPGQTLLELAVVQQSNPWTYMEANQLPSSWSALPGDVLHLPIEQSEAGAEIQSSALPEAISNITLGPGRMEQGNVSVIQIEGAPGIQLGGALLDRQLHFFPQGEGLYISMQGIHVMTDAGLYSMVISGTLPLEAPYFGAAFALAQPVLVYSGNYPFDPVLSVSPETIDPTVTQPEDAEWSALAATATPEKLWNGQFTSPVAPPFDDCWPSLFGNRRSYNGSEYKYFHSGLDFCGGVGIEIIAPAAGRVVFAGPLTVRGNATMIDHGWGIYSAYLHQSEILVKPGDLVAQGQVIGKIGGTGRVTGPHLHWEIWAGGVQVDPLQWLEETFPN
ncbi:MAG: peptidoglycan DD-metalloendopeptidase family protein [Anaerolineales bacterium]|jgi:murein DD-endopeptidase MepM/ murein hydrolase activator NlpD|nr:peptidoglycan DD-metalloendopeptidase family protein [Anaerolineales bacterium]